jgi:hypothetical protein
MLNHKTGLPKTTFYEAVIKNAIDRRDKVEVQTIELTGLDHPAL